MSFKFTYEEVKSLWDRKNRSINNGFSDRQEMISFARKKLGLAVTSSSHPEIKEYASKYIKARGGV